MNKINKLSKELLGIVEYSKEVIKSNLLLSNEKNTFNKLTDAQLYSVIDLVNVSLSQGVQKALPTFQKVVEDTLSETKKVTLESSKKKK